MESKTFLKERLAAIALQFPNVQIKYAYNYSIATHIVELTPESEYYNNEVLDAVWIPLSMEFSETFASESICFISSDSRLAISQSEFEWNKARIEWDMPAMNEVFAVMLHSKANLELPKTFSWQDEASHPIVIDTIQTHYNQNINLAGAISVQVFTNTNGNTYFGVKASDINAQAGNVQYAMAA